MDYVDNVKLTIIRFADQLLREIIEIQNFEPHDFRIAKTTGAFLDEGRSLRQQIGDAADDAALQKAHDLLTSLVTRVMFHRLAVRSQKFA